MSGLATVPLASVAKCNRSCIVSFIRLSERMKRTPGVYFLYSKTEVETVMILTKLNKDYFVSTEKTTATMKKLKAWQNGHLRHLNLVFIQIHKTQKKLLSLDTSQRGRAFI